MDMRGAAPHGLLASGPMIALVHAVGPRENDDRALPGAPAPNRIFAWMAAILFVSALAAAALLLLAGLEMLGRVIVNEMGSWAGIRL